MIIDLDRQAWAHLLLALRLHARWCRENGREAPADIVSLRKIAQKHDPSRQEPTDRAPIDEFLDDEVMRRKLAQTLHQVAERLQVSRRTVERLVADGALPSVRIGRARRIRVADLDAYVESRPTPHPTFRDDIHRKQAS